MDYSQKIDEATQKGLDAKDEISVLMNLADAEQRDLTEEEAGQVEVYAEAVKSAELRVNTLKTAEKALGLQIVQGEKKAPAIITRQGNGKDRPKGDLIFKMATTQFLASQHKMGVAEAQQKFYSRDADLEAIVKSVINPAATDVTGWAAELVDDALQGFLDILRGVSLGWDLLAGAGISLNFDGLGSITVPTREGANTDMRSGWVGERQAIVVRRGTTGSITIAPYKWGCISTFSKELAMRSTPSIEELVRQFIIQDTGTQLDNDLFGSDAAVTGHSPAGLMAGVTGTASAGATYANINTDIINLIDPLIAADCWQDPVIYLNPSNSLKMRSVMAADGTQPFRAELSAGNIMGIPVRESTNIAATEHLIVDRGSIASAVGAPSFTVSDTATLVEIDDDGPNAVDKPAMEDAYPRSDQSGQVGDAATWNADALNTTKAPIRSLFQTETVAVKNVQYLSWHRMRDECVNKIHTVAY